ncbi:MAG: hypothetical protein AAF662_07025 [Pseudomonadota bacterium]
MTHAINANSLATEFREKWPWHIQTIVYAFDGSEGDVHLLVSEPPSILAPSNSQMADLVALLDGKAGTTWNRTKRGMNGWVDDVVISAKLSECVARPSARCNEQLAETISSISSVVFGSAYKAHATPFSDVPDFDAFSAPKDLQIDAGGFVKLLKTPGKLKFRTWNHESIGSFIEMLDGGFGGVAYSDPEGLVAFSFSVDTEIADLRDEFRRFALDSDLLLGGVSAGDQSDRIVLIGRERQTGLFQVPPLRFEDLELAVNVRDIGQFQTFGTALFMGTSICDGKYEGFDFFPAFLSEGLVDTRFGSTLNFTDVLIKSYTEGGEMHVLGMDLPPPVTYPFKRADVFVESGGNLTYNWSLDRGIQILEDPQARFVMADHTNALSISYFAEEGPDLSHREVESQAYFLNLQSLPVFEARQITTLLSVTQNRRERLALEDSATAARTLVPAEEVMAAVYKNLVDIEDLQSFVASGLKRKFSRYEEADFLLSERLGTKVTADELLGLTDEFAGEFVQRVDSYADVEGLSEKEVFSSISDWLIRRMREPTGNIETPASFLSKSYDVEIDFVDAFYLDLYVGELFQQALQNCLAGALDNVVDRIDLTASGNIRTTDFVLSNLYASAVGGHNLHREELVFRPTTKANLTVREDSDAQRYIVEVPERLFDDLDMPKVIDDLKSRDLRGIRDAIEIPTPTRRHRTLASLIGKSRSIALENGAAAEHLPPRSLKTGYGWRSEVGRLNKAELDRHLAIAESRGLDLIVKSIGGDMVIYRKAPPGQFVIEGREALYEAFATFASARSKIQFIDVPFARIQAIMDRVPSRPSGEFKIVELEAMAMSDGNGEIANRGLTFTRPGGDQPLQIITYSKRSQGRGRQLLSLFLGRRPDWSQATIDPVVKSADEMAVTVNGKTYYELAWEVSLPPGRAENNYFQRAGTTLERLSTILVQAFSLSKWTEKGEAVGLTSLRNTLGMAGRSYDAGENPVTEDVIRSVRAEMQRSMQSEGYDARIRFLKAEREESYELGTLSRPKLRAEG